MSLIVKNIAKSFEQTNVLKDVSFEVPSGQIVCLRGKSGEGKTTILRCLNRLESVDSGQIWIDGLEITALPAKKGIADQIGMVFQNYHLFPHLIVWDNLMLAPKLSKVDKQESEQRALALLDKLGIREKADQYPYQLSGGQKQRVAIARACMLSPKVVCFDEPTSALDQESIQGIHDIIRDLASQGITVLIVTHDDKFADEIADRSVYLEDGRVREIVEMKR